MRRRSGSGRLTRAVLASAGLHAAALGGAWVSASSVEPPPRVRVFRVDIVSPPPSEAGEPSPVPPAPAETAPEPEPVPAEPEPAPQPAPEPEPVPAPAKKAPAPRPEARKPPAPEAQRESRRPQESARRTEQKKEDARSARTPAPATGERSDPSSPGGEGLRIRSPGEECPDQAYCENVPRQVRRYFRRPPEARADRGNVCFRIVEGGAVDPGSIEVRELRGSIAFKLALIEAVERAGQQRAFGPLPRALGAAFPVCVSMEPESS